jgi:hypothetical protein
MSSAAKRRQRIDARLVRPLCRRRGDSRGQAPRSWLYRSKPAPSPRSGGSRHGPEAQQSPLGHGDFPVTITCPQSPSALTARMPTGGPRRLLFVVGSG